MTHPMASLRWLRTQAVVMGGAAAVLVWLGTYVFLPRGDAAVMQSQITETVRVLRLLEESSRQHTQAISELQANQRMTAEILRDVRDELKEMRQGGRPK